MHRHLTLTVQSCICTPRCSHACPLLLFFFFFFNDTATTEIYTLSLHDALPISPLSTANCRSAAVSTARFGAPNLAVEDRKSTRLNSSHLVISYAVFCLKKKKKNIQRVDEMQQLHRSRLDSTQVSLSLQPAAARL